MAAARPLVGRNSIAENVIKQGYLKRSVRSADVIPSATKQIATNIKQKLEPSRWYVFGVRYGTPYLEYFESEERVFTGSPLEMYDLSSYRNLTYTLGRTNTNFTFCIFLEDRTIELTAHNRAQMLDWCRNLERHLRNLGIGNKKAKDDHTYSAFPVQPKSPRRSSLDSLEGAISVDGSTEDQNIYEDAENCLTEVKDVNHNNQSVPPLPPRPLKSDEEENIFASIYSVKKLPDNEYNNIESLDGDRMDFFTGDDGDDDTDTLKWESKNVGKSNLNGDRQENYVKDDDNEEDRCSSMPVIPTKHLESDTSEDSDFVSASFWLRNRKLDGLKSHDDSELESVKRKLPSIPTDQGDRVPPLPLRSHSMKPANGRKCMSMNLDPHMQNTERNLSTAAFYQTPVPKPTGPAVLKLDTEHENETKEKNVVERGLVIDQNEQKVDSKLQGLSLCDTKAQGTCENDSADDGEYEELVNTKTKWKRTSAEASPIYETTWGSINCKENSRGLETDVCDPVVRKTPNKVEERQPHLPPRKGLSKYFRSSKDKPLPDELIVSLPPRASCITDSNSETKELDTMQGNLYSDFPEDLGKANSPVKGSKSKSNGLDSDILKTSIENGPKLDKQTSPVLPKRNIIRSSSCVKVSSSEKTSVLKNPLSQSVSESRSNYYAIPSSYALGKNHNGSSEFQCKLSVKADSKPDELQYEEVESQPVAPPRRNRKKDQDSLERSDHSKQTIHKTVITCTPSAFESAPTLPMRNSPSFAGDEPPVPPRIDSLSDRHAPPLPITDNPPDRPAPLPPSLDSLPDKPAPPPPMRHGLSRSQSDARPEPPTGGARPKTTYLVTRQASQVGMNLKQNQVDILKAERNSSGGMVRTIPKVHFLNGLALVQCFEAIWIAGWDVKKYPRLYDKFHIGDQLISVNDVQLQDLAFAYKLVKNIKADHLEVTVKRLPNARIYAIQRSQEGEGLGIKRDGGTAEIVYVDPYGLAVKHGLTSKANTMSGGGLCNWTLTEINMRPLNLFFKDTEIEHRLLAVGKDISMVVQPSDFIKELKKQLKKVRSFKDYIVQ